ncbi:histone H1-like [Zingiber officinale]|uniref:H15 domain-containing protein n=1 Tax=Zingiber officinale TaxID=94328 RepID=A0A8J5H293_ZINOF|nr:histone H1-like [Zingiber officinale]KAG6515606.1 hypothetical protein ZIOFF_026035 [Zingiber officinale]
MVVASATPPAAAGRTRQHPPYKEMIVAAVKAIKDKRGSSAQAISKFIRGTYADLPLKHSAILKRHLRRLKKRGVLFMVRHSYKLTDALDGEIPPNGEKRRPGRPRKVALAVEGKKRKPGRPRKSNGEDAKSDSGAAVPKRKPGRPRKDADAGVTPKRKPGRPRKGDPMAAPVRSTLPKSSLATTSSGEKRKRGRPPKTSTEAALSGEKLTLFGSSFASAAATSSKEKKKPGRPPKSSSEAAQPQANLNPFALPNAPVAGASPSGKRKRGRPQKFSSDKIQSRDSLAEPAKASATGDAPVDAKRKPGRPPGSTTKKPNETGSKKLGRPKKHDVPAFILEGTSTAASSPKRRGRPPKKTDLEPPTPTVN